MSRHSRDWSCLVHKPLKPTLRPTVQRTTSHHPDGGSGLQQGMVMVVCILAAVLVNRELIHTCYIVTVSYL